jgi:hypothetical protein
MDTLLPHTRETHRVLEDRLSRAEGAHRSAEPREGYPAIDTFLAMAARHNAAVNAVLVPAARRKLDGGHELARHFVQQSRRFELALNQVKARLYGSVYAQRRTWSSLWSDVRTEFDHLWTIEEELAQGLAAARTGSDPDWSTLLYRVELHSPTRPHPYIPHQGIRGHLARSVAHRVDAFWDVAEGRMVPEPVHHHDREKDGRLTQYLLADPHLPES